MESWKVQFAYTKAFYSIGFFTALLVKLALENSIRLPHKKRLQVIAQLEGMKRQFSRWGIISFCYWAEMCANTTTTQGLVANPAVTRTIENATSLEKILWNASYEFVDAFLGWLRLLFLLLPRVVFLSNGCHLSGFSREARKGKKGGINSLGRKTLDPFTFCYIWPRRYTSFSMQVT